MRDLYPALAYFYYRLFFNKGNASLATRYGLGVFVISFLGLPLSATAGAEDKIPRIKTETPTDINDVGLSAKLTRLPPSAGNVSGGITGLAIDEPWDRVRLKESITKDGRPLQSLTIKGRFKPTPPDTKLVYAYSYDGRSLAPQIDLDAGGHFSVSIPIQGEQVYFEFKSIDRLGHVSSERFRVDSAAPLKNTQKLPAHRWNFNSALGITHLAYTETRIVPYTAILPTLKLGITYALSGQWSLGASGYMNLASLASSDSSVGVRFVGLNGRVGFSFPTGSPSWITTAMLGVYSLGMSATSNSLGFDRLYGPQFVIAERKTINSENAIAAYAKYSALLDGSGISLSKRELAGGLTYERRMGARNYTASVDASEFDFNIRLIQIQSRTLTFSLGMGL